MVNFWINLFDIQKWKKEFSRWFIVSILLILYIPLIFFILISFNSPSAKGNVPQSLKNWNGIQNYVSFFTQSSFSENMWPSLLNSCFIALISIPISLIIGLFTSLSIWRNYGKGYKSTFFSCSAIISTPDIVQGISFFILFSVLFVPLGINIGFFSVILTHIAIQIPYVIIFLYPKIQKLNPQLLWASYDLNFNFFEALINILLPLLWSNLLGAALVCFSISFDDYVITNLVRGNVPTIASELYSMKTGIKGWVSVFGSLIIVGTILGVFLKTLFQSIFKKNV